MSKAKQASSVRQVIGLKEGRTTVKESEIKLIVRQTIKRDVAVSTGTKGAGPHQGDSCSSGLSARESH